ncbi:hypothetical protein PO124_12850 [Bacillus licheniformis]|nr:hypothetical protein [Bacillus licheniformis]
MGKGLQSGKDDFYRLVYRPVYPYFIDAHDGKAFMSKTYNKRRLAGVESPGRRLL